MSTPTLFAFALTMMSMWMAMMGIMFMMMRFNGLVRVAKYRA